ncbi:Rieske (2Fe-2S) protein [Pseudomonas sp. R5(2019)]|uniref:Rieske (2Fe-2S) protein n=1 Tax=Pseudomonas sp. R5(2019) TaxID=2697566 RepID=UPI0014135D16|nr:Rieske (2Fe-2S) protein [Pseudomonas sp. R5(2019)]NBA96872.1 Rieske 2Fe-2S domain-containing protein [Pseudomonas sp. R5(2019)]
MFVALERLINLQEGYRNTFEVAGHQLLLLVQDNQPLLLENRCPHQGAPLHSATLSNGILRCQRHGIEFRLPGGQPVQAACPGLTLYKVAYEGDRIGIDV